VSATPDVAVEEEEEETNHVDEPVEEEVDEGITPKKPKTQPAKRSTVRSGLKIKLSNGHQDSVSIIFCQNYSSEIFWFRV
jgi:hypothetical protein